MCMQINHKGSRCKLQHETCNLNLSRYIFILQQVSKKGVKNLENSVSIHRLKYKQRLIPLHSQSLPEIFFLPFIDLMGSSKGMQYWNTSYGKDIVLHSNKLFYSFHSFTIAQHHHTYHTPRKCLPHRFQLQIERNSKKNNIHPPIQF